MRLWAAPVDICSRAPRTAGANSSTLGVPSPPSLLGLLAAWPLRFFRVEAGGVVEDRVLYGDADRLHLRLALRTRHRLGVSEELVLGQAFESGGRVHESTQALTTDNAIAGGTAVKGSPQQSASGRARRCWTPPTRTRVGLVAERPPDTR